MRLVIVEDDPLLLENLKLMLNGEKNITVTGAFPSAEEALPKLKRAPPDVMLVDLGLPGMSGNELIGKVKTMQPGVEIMVHTVYEDRDSVFSAIKAGASGYILKGSTPRELVEALYNVHQGGSPMSPKIARKVIREFQDESIQEQYFLSHRETEIVKSIEQGMSYKEIADRFSISPHTVHSHIKHIYEKLQAKDRQDALVKARKKGII
ncbi:MAG: DNA-binding response regulator [Nitrospirae bacterium GWC2_57_13]|nr:MAG: DNA-binding response regulator [Nitrospirae bacterium GWC1_57_7]OGW28009.1 MAG: DNA-binding response regulator [Nitrospirae bacterium GWC2_57_13]HAR45555.1 DNA-binding response regulator [Nitrospiraceae bacterium]HAS54735.1 DNA-binding response regulator [Nitrospiraceae bacterium]